MGRKPKYIEGDYLGPYNTLLIKRTKRMNGDYYGVFQCSFCNNRWETKIKRIVDGTIASCGCVASQRLVGKRFGKVICVSATNERYAGSICWRCKCDCGKEIILPSSRLKFDKNLSCGCDGPKYEGEEKIKQILKKNKINFIAQFRFKDCKDKNTLPFDFYLPDYNCCIEYDGVQHFVATGGWNTDEHLKYVQKHDSIKTKYCKENDILLIRIPYWDLNKINKEYLEIQGGLNL